MRLIREQAVTPATLTSNVPITETAWAAGTYATGVRRAVGEDLYEVTATPSTADEPVAGAAREPKTWVRVGKINRWRMFSEFVAEQTIIASPLTVEIDTPATANAVALFGLEAAAVEVVTYEGNVETARINKPMTNVNEVGNWFEYFFQPITKIEEGVVLDLPSYGTTRMVITVTNDTAPVAVGKLVIGEAVVLGRTSIEFGAGIEDFSRKERDEFGGYSIVERRFARRAEFVVYMDGVKVPSVLRHLAEVRARPTVYIGDPDVPESIVIGFYKDAWTTRQTRDFAQMTLEIEGLT